MGPLDDIRAKLDRAEYHLDALATETRRLVEGERQFVDPQPQATEGTFALILKDVPDIPPLLGVILGDFLHNTRSSLDHVVYALVDLTAPGKQHTTHQFPILDTPKEWTKKVTSPGKNGHGMLDFLDPTHIAQIERLQPYQPTTGLPSLAILRNFSNIDKHRLVHAGIHQTTAVPLIWAEAVLPATLQGSDFANPDTPLQNGAQIGIVTPDWYFPTDSGQPTLPTNAQVNVRADLDTTTLFGPHGQRQRIRDFRGVLADVREVVESFAAVLS